MYTLTTPTYYGLYSRCLKYASLFAKLSSNVCVSQFILCITQWSASVSGDLSIHAQAESAQLHVCALWEIMS